MLPIDTSRSDAAHKSRTLVDRFQPSARTPLAADRLLARQQSETAPLLGRTTDEGMQDSAKKGMSAETETTGPATESDKDAKSGEASKSGEEGTGSKNARNGELTEEQQKQVAELKRRDTEVRAHEQAHLSASGGLARGGASFSFQNGPDGKRYAVGGEVQIAMKSGNTPEETIRNAEQVHAAALAPANPSSVDQQTAAAASRMAQEARQELAAATMDKASSGAKSADSDTKEKSGTEAKPETAGTSTESKETNAGLSARTTRSQEKDSGLAVKAPPAGEKDSGLSAKQPSSSRQPAPPAFSLDS